MKLVKIEKQEEPIWYFTSPYKAGKFINTSPSNVYTALKGNIKQIKGWQIEWVEINDTDVNKQYLNPGDKEENAISELMKKLTEAVELLQRNGKRIEELENRIENLNELTNKLKKEL